MMIVFQNKIIYMPGLPPNSRWEKIEDYKARLGGLSWREERVRAADGTELALCVVDLELGSRRDRDSCLSDAAFYILYFQGLLIHSHSLKRARSLFSVRKCFLHSPASPGSLVHSEGIKKRDERGADERQLYNGMSELSGILDVARSANRERPSTRFCRRLRMDFACAPENFS